jgi:hypothetical protein
VEIGRHPHLTNSNARGSKRPISSFRARSGKHHPSHCSARVTELLT